MAVTYLASLFYQRARHLSSVGLLAQIDMRLARLAGTLYTIQGNGASRWTSKQRRTWLDLNGAGLSHFDGLC
jgi:hypothetical protein